MHPLASLSLLVAAVEGKPLLPLPAEEISYRLTGRVIGTIYV